MNLYIYIYIYIYYNLLSTNLYVIFIINYNNLLSIMYHNINKKY